MAYILKIILFWYLSVDGPSVQKKIITPKIRVPCLTVDLQTKSILTV